MPLARPAWVAISDTDGSPPLPCPNGLVAAARIASRRASLSSRPCARLAVATAYRHPEDTVGQLRPALPREQPGDRHALSPRERAVLWARYSPDGLEPERQKERAERLGLWAERVR